jgi:hypothetical protein
MFERSEGGTRERREKEKQVAVEGTATSRGVLRKGHQRRRGS